MAEKWLGLLAQLFRRLPAARRPRLRLLGGVMAEESPLPPSSPLPSSCASSSRHGGSCDYVTSPAKRSKLVDAAAATTPTSPACEVEQVEKEEFEFLDGMTRLAAMETEVEDVKRGLMVQKQLDKFVPFRLFNRWGHRIVSVTDLTGGTWCELNVEYKKLHPHLKHSQEWKKQADKGRPVVLKTESMIKGSEVHFKKELEVHDIVRVEMQTKEDRVTVQLVNTFTQLSLISGGKTEREIAVFGDLFDSGVLVRGIVDQLQYCKENNELILTDHKTRRTDSFPSPEQKKCTSFQLMLYKYLLDRMILGLSRAELLYRHLNLKSETRLNQGPLKHIQDSGLGGLFSERFTNPGGGEGVVVGGGGGEEEGGGGGGEEGGGGRGGGLTFGRVAEGILDLIAGLDLPLVNSSLLVHYEYQGSGKTIGIDSIDYDEQWMQEELQKRLEYWDGSRPAQGVDIEETWKCWSCQFREVCTFRLRGQLEHSPFAKLPTSP